MKVIRPVAITPARLISSDVPEDDHAEWNSATTYTAGTRVIRTAAHRRYESLIAGNMGFTPENSPTKWLDIGPTNRWAMFDERVGTDTVREADLNFAIQPGTIDTLALLDTDAESAEVSMTIGSTTVYSALRSFNAAGVPIVDWYAYFFAEIGRKTSVMFDDLPPYPGAIVNVSIIGGGAVDLVSVGTLIVGRAADLGSAEYGVDIGIIDYSRKETDQFGVTDVTKRGFAKRMGIRTMFNTDQLDAFFRLLGGLRATPVLWVGASEFDTLTIYGFYKEFSIDLAYATVSYCSLTIEGLT